MSNKNCNRTLCENIKCAAVIWDHKICLSCLNDFKRLVGDTRFSEREWFKRFIEFMQTPAEPGNPDKIMSVNEFIAANNSMIKK